MANTPNINAPQAHALVVHRRAAGDIRLPQGNMLAVYNIPAQNMFATFSGAGIVYSRRAVHIEVTQAHALAVVKGRIANPRLRAWTFTLDGHDFYVLRLGESETLVYDTLSKQWVNWADKDNPFWRPNIGLNWLGGTAQAQTMGSNVLVGDDNYGLLWFLDPKQPFDQHPDQAIDTDQYFERIVMGQVPMSGRAVAECYAIYLSTDVGAPAYTGAGITLLTSDDAGNNFTDQGLVQVPAGTFDTEITWRSLGQITSPGRLFKLVDDGAVHRIDDLDMNDDGDQ